jgi:hypothetical protein
LAQAKRLHELVHEPVRDLVQGNAMNLSDVSLQLPGHWRLRVKKAVGVRKPKRPYPLLIPNQMGVMWKFAGPPELLYHCRQPIPQTQTRRARQPRRSLSEGGFLLDLLRISEIRPPLAPPGTVKCSCEPSQ